MIMSSDVVYEKLSMSDDKNNDGVARSAFIEHLEILLREDHIAVSQGNWNDKATNIAAITQALSLGLDSR